MRLAILISNKYRRLQLTTSHPMQSCSGQRMFSVFLVVVDSSFVFSSRHMFCDFLFFGLGVHSFLSFWLLSSINKRKKNIFHIQALSPLEKLNEFCFRFDFLFFCSIARKEVFLRDEMNEHLQLAANILYVNLADVCIYIGECVGDMGVESACDHLLQSNLESVLRLKASTALSCTNSSNWANGESINWPRLFLV